MLSRRITKVAIKGLIRDNLKILWYAAIAIVVSGGVLTGLILAGPVSFEHPLQRVALAHSQDQVPIDSLVSSGCAICHEKPITTVACSSCHDAPTTVLEDIRFTHHTEGEDGPSCNECHAAAGDIRFVEIPLVTHTYCQTCHELDHD